LTENFPLGKLTIWKVGWSSGMQNRGMSKREAAEYCGCRTVAAFDRWRRDGVIKIEPIPGTNVFDRVAVDRALNAVSGITDAPAVELSPYQRAKAEHASKAQAA
jgi:hypothetical protein